MQSVLTEAKLYLYLYLYLYLQPDRGKDRRFRDFPEPELSLVYLNVRYVRKWQKQCVISALHVRHNRLAAWCMWEIV